MNKLTNAQLTLTAMNGDQPVTLTGAVKDVNLETQYEYDTVYPSSFSRVFRTDQRHTLTFVPDEEGIAYTIKVEGKDVERLARIEVPARTAKAIETARKRVGAPEDAQFNFVNNRPELVLDTGGPYKVEFTWTEKVYS